MHNIKIIKRNRKMKFIIKEFRSGLEIAMPVCELSKKACALVNEKYLIPSQLKIIEKMGFDLEYKREEIKTSECYSRGAVEHL